MMSIQNLDLNIDLRFIFIISYIVVYNVLIYYST